MTTNIITDAEKAGVDVFAGISNLFGLAKDSIASGAKVATSSATSSIVSSAVEGIENMVTGDNGAAMKAIDDFRADIAAKKWTNLPHDIEACIKTGFAILAKFGVNIPIASAVVAALPDIPQV